MSVKVRKRKNAWWIFICYHGRRLAKKIGTREAAERVKREIEARLTLGDLTVLDNKEVPTLIDFAQKWLRLYAENECKESTVASYARVVHGGPELEERAASCEAIRNSGMASAKCPCICGFAPD